MHHPPGTQRPERFRPRFHYELLVCGLSGHRLVGTDTASFRPEDGLVAREIDGVRWHRCLRCDSWLPLPAPASPAGEHPPEREEIRLPLRGRPLRDKIVLRLIAIDRAFHFVVLGALSVCAFLLLDHEDQVRQTFYDIVRAIQGAPAAPREGFLGEIDKILHLHPETIRLAAFALAVYAMVELAEAVGLWLGKRWAEYLTFLATCALLPLEIYELTRSQTPLKVIALIVNLAIVGYLLWAKRLFGVRGGTAAEEADKLRDIGWGSLERTRPEATRP